MPMTLVVTSVPGTTTRLSEGVALKASVVARLLGVRLLTLDATVLVAPAEIAGAAAGPASPERPARTRRRSSLARSSRAARPSGDGRGRAPVGSDLTDAARCIDESALSLRAARIA
jgi:hypothetical protein